MSWLRRLKWLWARAGDISLAAQVVPIVWALTAGGMVGLIGFAQGLPPAPYIVMALIAAAAVMVGGNAYLSWNGPSTQKVSPELSGPAPSTLDHWVLVDWFAINHAASLWLGRDPMAFSLPTRRDHLQISQAIIAQVNAGKIRAYDRNHDPLPKDEIVRSDHHVCRDDLMKFASERGQFPSFLFPSPPAISKKP